MKWRHFWRFSRKRRWRSPGMGMPFFFSFLSLILINCVHCITFFFIFNFHLECSIFIIACMLCALFRVLVNLCISQFVTFNLCLVSTHFFLAMYIFRFITPFHFFFIRIFSPSSILSSPLSFALCFWLSKLPHDRKACLSALKRRERISRWR